MSIPGVVKDDEEESDKLTLLHERADGEPHAVEQRELVHEDPRVRFARVRILPLVRREAGENEEHEAHYQVGGDHVQPDVDGERREEREQVWRFLLRPFVEDADAEIEERLRKVDGLFALEADGQRSHGQVRFLFGRKRTNRC